MASIEKILEDVESGMMDAIDALERDFSGYRTGKASPALVENLMVDYYGTMSRLRDIASISTPEPRMLVVQPWDQNALAEIEKALHSSEIGISPVSDGRIIRLPVPELSEERRKELAKQVHKRAEQAKVEVRNFRRKANDEAKKAEKASEITEDDLKDVLNDMQKTTDSYIQQIDDATKKKETELMQV